MSSFALPVHILVILAYVSNLNMVVLHFRRTVVQVACCNMYIGPGERFMQLKKLMKTAQALRIYKNDICPGLFHVHHSD